MSQNIQMRRSGPLLFCFFYHHHIVLDERDVELSAVLNLPALKMEYLLVPFWHFLFCERRIIPRKKKRDHWINSMNFMNVNLIFFLISQWEISPRFSLSILCQLLILCFFCNSFISPTPGCLCGLLYFPVMLKVMRTHTQWIAKQTMWSAEQLHITVTGSIYAAHLHSMKASFFGHKRLMRLESSRFRDCMKSLMK